MPRGIDKRGTHMLNRILNAISLLCVLCHGAQAQCNPGWAAGEGIPGVDGEVNGTNTVNAFTAWDPGTGPVTVVGGLFRVAGNSLANNVAVWNGSSWSALGAGVTGRVNALRVYHGQLHAGMDQLISGSVGSCIARWNGGAWEPVGGTLNGHIHAMAELNGELIVAGDNLYLNGTSIGGTTLAWNGSTWRELGFSASRGFALAVHDGQLVIGGNLFAPGGPFLHVGTWNGSAWQPLGQMSLDVTALADLNGTLYAAAGGAVFAWNGTNWNSISGPAVGAINSLTVDHGELIAGGAFTSIAGIAANHVAAWNGTDWHALGWGANAAVNTVASVNGTLFMGGPFTASGGIDAMAAARWDGTAWRGLGTGFAHDIVAATTFNSELIVGGPASSTGPANTLYAWNGTSWRPFAFGFAPASNGVLTIGALTVYNGELIVGGTFIAAGGVPASNIAAWNGQAWHALGLGISPTIVHSLLVYNGELIAAGHFTSAGGVPANNIAAWNGSSWRALGSGTEGGSGTGRIYSMVEWNGNLVIVGAFGLAGGVPVRNVALWDGAWHNVGFGVGNVSDGVAFTAAVFNNDLYIGGQFSQAGFIVAGNLARWNGSDWVPTASANYDVTALFPRGGHLIAAGAFTSLGTATNGIADYDGTTWRALGAGLSRPGAPHAGPVSLLASYRDDLIAVGGFLTAGGAASPHFARWTCICYANCDASIGAPALNINDFQCFLNRFATGDPYANCDGSTAPPTLNAADFQCFLGSFAAGCP